MRKGISNILLILIIIIFVCVPVIFFVFRNKESLPSEDVRGISTSEESTKRNFYVTVDTPSGTWQLMQYLCSDIGVCSESLTSGTELASVSGGSSSDNKILVTESLSWADYSYMKLFVRSGWGLDESSFIISSLGSIEGTKKVNIESSGDAFEVAIVPISSLGYQTVASVTFEDSGVGSFYSR